MKLTRRTLMTAAAAPALRAQPRKVRIGIAGGRFGATFQWHLDPAAIDRLPAPMRVRTGHGNSRTFLTHEFISAIQQDRHPAINAWEAAAYTLPGIAAHQPALPDGAAMKIRDYGAAPA